MPVMFKDEFPVFTSVTVVGLLLIPTMSGEKFCRAGYAARKAPLTPVPLTGIAKGLIRVLSVIVTVPDSGPVIAGEKVTLTSQLPPELRLAWQLLVSAKPALAAMLAISIFTLLGLMTVMDWDALVVPTP